MNEDEQKGKNASADPGTPPSVVNDQMVGHQVAALIEKLVYQTSVGNIHWVQKAGTVYVFEGSSARVELKSVDGDGLLPLSIEIFDSAGKRRYGWMVDFSPEEDDVWFDSQIKSLWEMVFVSDDALGSLIEDLDALPPF